jgi:hypothetical protein
VRQINAMYTMYKSPPKLFRKLLTAYAPYTVLNRTLKPGRNVTFHSDHHHHHHHHHHYQIEDDVKITYRKRGGQQGRKLFYFGYVNVRGHLRDQDVDEGIILKCDSTGWIEPA